MAFHSCSGPSVGNATRKQTQILSVVLPARANYSTQLRRRPLVILLQARPSPDERAVKREMSTRCCRKSEPFATT